MRTFLKPLLIFVALLLLSGGGFLVWKNFKNIPQKATLSVETPFSSATVFLDDQSLGSSPVSRSDLDQGEYTLRIESEQNSFQTKISLLGGTATMVRRELAPTDTFSGGDVLWFEKAGSPASLSVTSEPDAVSIKLDGQPLGETPQLVDEVSAGEHELRLEKEGFETRILKILAEPGFRLRISSKLALQPVATAPAVLDSGSEKIVVYRLASNQTASYVDKTSLMMGIAYWLKSRGQKEELAEILYLLDGDGAVYDLKGEIVNLETLAIEEGTRKEKLTVGFVEPDGESLPDKAKLALNTLAAKVLKTPPLVDKVEILQTGTGWLRVRAEASLSASEITKINVGEKFLLLEEKEGLPAGQAGWVKIKLLDGGVGWVSSDYVRKFQEAL